MAKNDFYFKPAHSLLGGYYIPVRNDWNYKIQLRHISEQDKELYLQHFGEDLITDSEFYNWWKENHFSEKKHTK